MKMDITAGKRSHYGDITTDRLILRQSNNERDLENYLSHLKSADEFYIQYGMEYSDDLFKLIDFQNGSVIYYSVFLKEQNVMVGYVGITPYLTSNSGEIEFYIFKEYRRNHYASEALSALIDWFMSARLSDTSEKRITAETLSENEISCKLLEYIGFQREALGIRLTMAPADIEEHTQPIGFGLAVYKFTGK